MSTRRDFIGGAGAALAAQTRPLQIVVDPTPRYAISPHLYMQFLEPLGATDSGVEAAWDYETDDWRKDFIDATAQLSPGLIRFGGILSRYYKWREGVGPVASRAWYRNYAWGGKETHRMGTHEFAELCRRVGADALVCVNFLGDGVKRYASTREGNRIGDAREAADWVSYCNDPDHRERRAHGALKPYNIRLWQIGNETSYGTACFPRDESIAHTIEFSRAMRDRDRALTLIAWGDGDRGRELWAPELVKRAGEHFDLVAFHMMGMGPRRKNTWLWGQRYQQAPEEAWQELRELAGVAAARLTEFEQAAGARHGIAITEGHLSLAPHNSNAILGEWLSAVYHAMTLNNYQRHGARVKIATAADYPTQRWTVGSLMVPVPGGNCFLMPVGSIMRLFRRHNGTEGVEVTTAPSDLDIAASRTGDRVFLHVANLDYRNAIDVPIAVNGRRIVGGRVYEIAPDDPRAYVNRDQPGVFAPVQKPLSGASWRFPARSVSAVELDLAPVDGAVSDYHESSGSQRPHFA